MRYLGSKNKLAPFIVPILQDCIDFNKVSLYFEPFVGGANIIDKIKCRSKKGVDIQPELIALLKQTQTDTSIFPDVITYEEYKKVKNNRNMYPAWYVGLVGFCASFGAKYFGGYARNCKNDNSGNWSQGAIKNLKKQALNLKNIDFVCCDYLSLNENMLKNYVVYCDPPYMGTTKYQSIKFEHDVFWQWVRDISAKNFVFVSEYNAPKDFIPIWERSYKTLIDSNKQKKRFIELPQRKTFYISRRKSHAILENKN